MFSVKYNSWDSSPSNANNYIYFRSATCCPFKQYFLEARLISISGQPWFSSCIFPRPSNGIMFRFKYYLPVAGTIPKARERSFLHFPDKQLLSGHSRTCSYFLAIVCSPFPVRKISLSTRAAPFPIKIRLFPVTIPVLGAAVRTAGGRWILSSALCVK